MSNFWDWLFNLDRELSIWVEEEDLGQEKLIYCNNRRYAVRIPQAVHNPTTLRLTGLGAKRLGKTGNMYLHVWLNKGEDVRKSLWLSQTSARYGADKRLFTGDKTITLVVPPRAHDGLTIRLKAMGSGPHFDRRIHPPARMRRGDLLVKLCVYPDSVTPIYRAAITLSDNDMVLEGWVYRKFDEVMSRLGSARLPGRSIPAQTVADVFNENGYTGIFTLLVHHLKLTQLSLDLRTSAAIARPGSCETRPVADGNAEASCTYRITVNERFLDNPFSVAAILAHELCHVLYTELIDDTAKRPGYLLTSEKTTLEVERTVDLLLFMFKLGEFQLRVAREKGLVLGYFNQEVFERIQVIVSRKSISP